VLAAKGDRLHYIVYGPRDDNADRHLTIVRGIGRVERAAAGIEPHLALDACVELRGQGIGIDVQHGLRSWRHRLRRVTLGIHPLELQA